jgi:hypothetical protein
MEEYTGIAHYDFRTKPDRGSVDRLIEKLLNDNNIVDVNTGENSISIEYYQQLTSREKLQTLIENAGIELLPATRKDSGIKDSIAAICIMKKINLQESL